MSLTWIGTLLLGAVAFLLGRVFAQSDRVLDQKRMVYEQFLKLCPAPNEAHSDSEMLDTEMQRAAGLLSLYGSLEVANSTAKYFQAFAEGQEKLAGVTEIGHAEFIKVMSAYNKMKWDMRTDAMAWSVFATPKRSRKFDAKVPLETIK